MGSPAHALLVAVVLVVAIVGSALPALAAQVGFQGHSFAGFGAESSGGSITGQKPESKLWYHDGFWWAAMVSPTASGAHTIWKLGATSWTNTGTVIDTRPATKEDVLSLGSTLYVLSRTGSSGSNKIRRFTYASGAYSLDAGFPVDVPGAGKETAVLARDTTGKLWITYTSGSQVFVVHSLGSDTSWGSAFVVPVASSATSVSSDDISSVISFTDATGPAIGVFWSNQSTSTDHFAVHRDGDNDSTWSLETALTGTKEADDHINLKTVEGRVYAVVKTSQTKGNSPLIRLLVRDTAGTWTKHPVALVKDGNTRPITMLQLDAANRRIYVFMTKGEGTGARGIQYRSSPMDGAIAFGSSTVFIQGPGTEPINDATSMKANADPTTGIVVLASDGTNYWWNKLGGGAPPNTPPTAAAGSGTTNEDTSVPLTLSGSDPDTCQLTFSIVTQPLHGTVGSITNQACVAGSPNTDTAQVTYTPAANYSGPDSFTFKVNDGFTDSPPGTVSLTVNPVNDLPIASAGSATTAFDTPVTVTVNGSDVESCELTFTVVTQPLHGSAGAPGALACVAGAPNTDSATILYTPTIGYSGPDSFTFKVNDGTADSSAATVSITVSPPGNTPPTADAVTDSTSEDTAKEITLIGHDAETCELTFSIVTGPAHGSLDTPSSRPNNCTPGAPNTDTGTVTYTPTAGYNGPDSFTYLVNDETADSSAATVSITVSPPGNTPPTADAVTDSTSEDTAKEITLTGHDAETCELTFSIVTGPVNGSLDTPSSAPNNCTPGAPNTDTGTVTYTPTANYSGSDSFTYKVNDGFADSAAATVTLTVSAVNDVPVASPKSASTTEDTPVTITVNGSDVESCELTFSVVTPPLHGTAGTPGAVACVAGAPNTDSASILYTPTTGYSGPDSFQFKVNDGTADSPAATVTITVNAGAAGIAFRSASGAANPTATTLAIPAPSGMQAGDVMLAQVTARGNPTLTPPAGWTLVRLDLITNTIRQGVWWKVVGSEPASYTWTLSTSQAASGGIVAYSGVNTTTPVDVHGGAVSATTGTSIVAPSVTTTVNGAMLVGFFGIASNTSILPPGGLAERYDVASSAGTYKTTSECADGLQATAGATGTRTATAANAAFNIGQLVALRPSGT